MLLSIAMNVTFDANIASALTTDLVFVLTTDLTFIPNVNVFFLFAISLDSIANTITTTITVIVAIYVAMDAAIIIAATAIIKGRASRTAFATINNGIGDAITATTNATTIVTITVAIKPYFTKCSVTKPKADHCTKYSLILPIPYVANQTVFNETSNFY